MDACPTLDFIASWNAKTAGMSRRKDISSMIAICIYRTKTHRGDEHADVRRFFLLAVTKKAANSRRSRWLILGK